MKIISFVLFSCIGNQAIDISIHEYTLRDPLLFGDYRNMINENEPRFYEDLLDYEAIYFLFQEVLMILCGVLFIIHRYTYRPRSLFTIVSIPFSTLPLPASFVLLFSSIQYLFSLPLRILHSVYSYLFS